MEILVVIISWLLFGGASSYFAKQRGRDPFAWFLIGMLLGILSLLLLFLLPPLNREQPEVSKENAPKEESYFRLKQWYYLDDQRQQIGPNTFSELKKAGELGKIHQNTLFWSEGMEGWKALSELPIMQDGIISFKE